MFHILKTLRVFQTVVTDGCFDTAEESVEPEKIEESKMNGMTNTQKDGIIDDRMRNR